MTFSVQVAVLLFAPLAVAAVFTFLTAWMSGRNARRATELQNDLAAKMKLADFRQAWINQLRESLAEFQSLGLCEGLSQPETTQHYRLAVKIRLSMNPEDDNYEALSEMLDKLINDPNPDSRAVGVEKLTRLSQDVLKTEWEVLKRDLRYKPNVAQKQKKMGTGGSDASSQNQS